MITKNSLGGINDRDPKPLEMAKKVDLVTFPKDMEGTNCYNCKWISEKKPSMGFCINRHVKQYVNQRMCCALWDNNSAYRPYGSQDIKTESA